MHYGLTWLVRSSKFLLRLWTVPCTGIQHSWGMTLKYISKSLSMIMNNNPQLLTWLPLRSAISSSTTTSPWPLRTSSRSTGGPVGDGRLRWGWGEVNSCLGIWPNSMICFSRAQRWLRSTVLKKKRDLYKGYTRREVSKNSTSLYDKILVVNQMASVSCSVTAVTYTFFAWRI